MHHLLTYAPKRIHFGTETFVMRMNLACMDWVSEMCVYTYHILLMSYNYYKNENVGRRATSEVYMQDLKRPNRRTPFRVLVCKSFKFVDEVWKLYVSLNCQDIRCVLC